MHSTLSLRSFPSIVFETVQCSSDYDGPLSSFQGRSSSASSFHASLLQAINGMMSLALCLQANFCLLTFTPDFPHGSASLWHPKPGQYPRPLSTFFSTARPTTLSNARFDRRGQDRAEGEVAGLLPRLGEDPVHSSGLDSMSKEIQMTKKDI